MNEEKMKIENETLLLNELVRENRVRWEGEEKKEKDPRRGPPDFGVPPLPTIPIAGGNIL